LGSPGAHAGRGGVANHGIMFNDPTLPPSLLSKLTEKGYEVQNMSEPLDLGAEKFIYGAAVTEKVEGAAEPTKSGAVVLYSKRAGRDRWAWKYQRELEVFQDLKAAGEEHKHIIRMLDFLPPSQGSDSGMHGPCMVLERVDPLGFDMFKVVKQYQGAKTRTLPVAQWMHYLGQLIEAVEHLHNRGWVHCDLKPDNVMVGEGHDIKVIDFGYSRRNRVENCPGRVALYVPPEFSNTRAKVDKSGDLWLIGAMMFVVFAQMQVCFRSADGRLFEVTNHSHAKKHGVVAAIREWWGKAVDPVMGEAIDNLLRRDPLERWTLPRLRKWWQAVKGDLNREQLLPIVSKTPTAPSRCFSKAPPLDRLVKAFGLEVTADSDLAGKYIGSHTAASGEVIEGRDKVIDFRRFAGATVLFIDRGAELVKIPSAKDSVRQGDWVYYLLHEEMEMETEEQREFQRKAQEVRSVGVEIWLEFDWFEFPEYVSGATVGEIGMGKLFGINVHFVARASDSSESNSEVELPEASADEVSRQPSEAQLEALALSFLQVGRDTVIQRGDRALVCRVPDRETGRSHSILSDELLSPLLDEKSFRQRCGMEDDARWAEWRTTCSERPPEATKAAASS